MYVVKSAIGYTLNGMYELEEELGEMQDITHDITYDITETPRHTSSKEYP